MKTPLEQIECPPGTIVPYVGINVPYGWEVWIGPKEVPEPPGGELRSISVYYIIKT